jgi:hypothetical protein
MFTYAAAQVSQNGPKGIASYPWQWLYDVRWIVYLNVDPSRPAPGLYRITPPVHFLGMINPPILLAAVLGVVWAASRLWAERGIAVLGPAGGRAAAGPDPALRAGSWHRGRHTLPAVAVAWSVATWLPFEVLSLVDSRTSYLYYMVIVMPGLYLGAVLVAERLWRVRWLAVLWMLLVLAGAIVMYPFTPWPS